ncbi:hypothetical protein KIW84_058131 [Lathyrus oleraceus]|uniref:Retrovirus-related Pol polyprotein from transposon TNT 1-94-like beta-barrel domain-containing protein n=1 Tax=Pisum sativum TaxID=3888 RepID=A0A9D4X7Z7_PEA|nr:hypothetical protein KIW84_058131 [Pisum sativum]
MEIPSASINEEVAALQVQTHEGHSNARQGTNYFRGKNQGHNSSKGHIRVCTHCNMTNHTFETCFLKHGFPPGFKGKGKGQVAASVNNTSEASPKDSTSYAYGFTQEQYNNILALLQQSKPNTTVNSVSTSPFVMNSHASSVNGKNPNLWILDTDATNHFSFNFSSFVEYKNIVPIPVSLPDGSQVVASVSGTVAISPSLTLHNVLYIPSFHVNLISIAKLVDSNNCFVQFNANTCHILQNHSKEMIGHISNIGLQSVAKVFPFISCNKDNVPCDSCHFAKQRKLPFPDSITNSCVPFNILHADLWGPYSTISTLGHRYFLTLVDDYSRHTWVIFLKTKDQTKTSLIQFIAYIENQNVVFYENTFPFKHQVVTSEFVPSDIPHIQNLDDPQPVIHIDQPSPTDLSLSPDVSTSTHDTASSPFNFNFLNSGPTPPSSPDLIVPTSPHPTNNSPSYNLDIPSGSEHGKPYDSISVPRTVFEPLPDHTTPLPDEFFTLSQPSAYNSSLPQTSVKNLTLPSRQSSRASHPPPPNT